MVLFECCDHLTQTAACPVHNTVAGLQRGLQVEQGEHQGDGGRHRHQEQTATKWVKLG